MNDNAYFSEASERFELFQTPESVKNLFLCSDSHNFEKSQEAAHFYANNIRAEVQKWIMEKGGVEGKRFIYIPESVCSPEAANAHQNQPSENTWLHSQIIFTMERIREEVMGCLEENGAFVLRPTLSYKEKGWVRFPSHPRLAYKISPQLVQNNPQQFGFPVHRNVSDERFYPLPEGKMISIATYREYPTLRQVLLTNIDASDKKECLAASIGYLRDAMKGCYFLHQLGLVHGDVKHDNIFVAQESGKQFGMLFDLEGASSPLTSRNICWSTDEYAERSYYEREKYPSIPVDTRWDVFSFGISLLELCAPHFDFKNAMEKCKQQTKRFQKQEALYECIDKVWPEFLSQELLILVKKMLTVSRYPLRHEDKNLSRPSLEEVISKLQEMEKEGKFFAQTSAIQPEYQRVA